MKAPAPPSTAAERDATPRPAPATSEAAEVERRAMEAARRLLTTPKPGKTPTGRGEPKPATVPKRSKGGKRA